jgi:hypothetical protein
LKPFYLRIKKYIKIDMIRFKKIGNYHQAIIFEKIVALLSWGPYHLRRKWALEFNDLFLRVINHITDVKVVSSTLYQDVTITFIIIMMNSIFSKKPFNFKFLKKDIL